MPTALIFTLVFSSMKIFAGEDSEYKKILKLKAFETRTEFIAEAKTFLKKYPSGPRASEVRLLLAEINPEIEQALSGLEKSAQNHPKKNRRSGTRLARCQILFLLSRWSDLRSEASAGLALHNTQETRSAFRRYLAMAELYQDNPERARDQVLVLCESDRNSESLPGNLLLLAQITKKISGYSRDYLDLLRDILLGFYRSDSVQTALFLLGDYFEEKKEYDRAFSAYSDVVKYFPSSPEAMLAADGIARLSDRKPRKVKYLPDRGYLARTERISLSPERDAEEAGEGKECYSVTVGPFPSANKADAMKASLSGYEKIRIVKLRSGFILLVGEEGNADAAHSIRIRLAEEYGINGKLVRLSRENGRSYLYGD